MCLVAVCWMRSNNLKASTLRLMSPTYSCHLLSSRPFSSVIEDLESWSQSFHSAISGNFNIYIDHLSSRVASPFLGLPNSFCHPLHNTPATSYHMGLSIRDRTADHCSYFLKGILSVPALPSFCHICTDSRFPSYSTYSSCASVQLWCQRRSK